MALHPWMDAFRQRLTAPAAPRARKRLAKRPTESPRALERLEDKSLLSATAFLVGSELQILSDAGEDVVVREDSNIAGRVEILIDGSPLSAGVGGVTTSQVTSLLVRTGPLQNDIDLSGVDQAAFPNLALIRVEAGDGDDSIIGSPDVPESLAGQDGEDTIDGQAGDDTILAGDGDDEVTGGDGNDFIDAGDGNDSVTAGDGDDTVIGDDGQDTISGGLGNDDIRSGDGLDSVTGDDGDDTLNGGGGDDTLEAGDGDDKTFGGAGADSIDSGDGNDTVIGNGGEDTIFGGAGDDMLEGRQGPDRIIGADGNDTVRGGAGNDDLEGGTADDLIVGGGGHDFLFDEGAGFTNPGTSTDTLLGQGGNDTLLGFSGSDLLEGGAGRDLIDTRAVTLSIEDLMIDPELDFGETSIAMFNVTLSTAFSRTIRVDFATRSDGTDPGGTAIVDEDYLPGTGTITFLPGQTTATVPVTILGDDVDETEETFFVDIFNASGAAIVDGTAEGRIIDDDRPALDGRIDIMLLIDDTGSFSSAGPSIQQAFGQIITDLQRNIAAPDLAFGVGRFEAYTEGGSNRPFILNQPIIETATPLFQQAIDAALQRLSPGGGRSEESIFEALFQTATGAGFDGNADGDSVDDGPAGPFTTQTAAGPSGDIPAFDTFVPDLTGDPLGPIINPTVPPATATDGVGFRPGARHIVLLATDSTTFVHEDDGAPIYSGVNGATVAASVFAQGRSNGGTIVTPGDAGAGVQETIDAMIAEGIEVIGLGESFSFFGAASPRTELEAIALLTGAVNNTGAPIENNITPGPSADDTQPDEPLYFEIDSNDPIGLAQIIVTAITSAVGDTTAPPPPPPPPPAPITGPQEDTIFGGTGRDTIFAADTDDLIIAGSARDSVDGGGGRDTIYGGGGNDTLNGAAGDDSLLGQGGNDLLDGGDGEDVLIWNGLRQGNDTLTGGDGADRVVVSGTSGPDVISIGQTFDGLITVTEDTAMLTVDDTVSNIVVELSGGDDVITFGNLNNVALSSLRVDGQVGNDLLDASGADFGRIRVSLTGGDGNDTLVGSDGHETLTGGDGHDSLLGGDGSDVLRGDAGVDTLDGQAGNDLISGGDGDDTLIGGVGDDSLSGGNEFDLLDGGDGNDTLRGGIGNDTLLGAVGRDSLLGDTGQDVLIGGSGADTLDGGRNDDTLRGNSGADKLRGDHGDDVLHAGGGDDELVGGDGNDSLYGGDGNDGLSGGDGSDVLAGQADSDTIVGGDGDDILNGAGGADTLLGQLGDDRLDGGGATDKGALGEGEDPPPLNVEVIDESFVLSSLMLQSLDGV